MPVWPPIFFLTLSLRLWRCAHSASFYYIRGQDLRLGAHNQQNLLGGEALCETSAVFVYTH